MRRKRERSKPAKDLQFDNELRKAKMAIEQGAHFGGGKNIPPEVESAFLDNIEKFEKEFNNCRQITVFERLGKPLLRNVSEIKENQIKKELDRLMNTMENHGLIAESIYDVDDIDMYRFITEDLFPQEIDDIRVPGMMTHFTYEEFHPNYEGDATERTRDFVKTILLGRKKDDEWFLNEHIKVITHSSVYNAQFLNDIKLFRSFYESFEIELLDITDLQMNDEKTRAEVTFDISVTATLEGNTGTQTISGQGKAEVQREDEWWEIIKFEMPGIKLC